MARVPRARAWASEGGNDLAPVRKLPCLFPSEVDRGRDGDEAAGAQGDACRTFIRRTGQGVTLIRSDECKKSSSKESKNREILRTRTSYKYRPKRDSAVVTPQREVDMTVCRPELAGLLPAGKAGLDGPAIAACDSGMGQCLVVIKVNK